MNQFFTYIAQYLYTFIYFLVANSLFVIMAMRGELMGNNPAPRVTVWIHGTRGAAFLPTQFIQSIKETEERMCVAPEGLHQAYSVPEKFYQRTIPFVLNQADSEQFPLEHSYVFGWSGKLSFYQRINAGAELKQALINLTNDYTIKYGATPSITLITHSHGGNVAAQMAYHYSPHDTHFSIDRLILLGCPIQHKTQELVMSPLFKKVISLYSPNDMIQRLDPQKIHLLCDSVRQAVELSSWSIFKESLPIIARTPWLSQRTLKPDEKVIQLGCTWNGLPPWTEQDLAPFGIWKDRMRRWIEQYDQKPHRPLLHIEFMLPSFLSRLPEILNTLDLLNHRSMPISI